MNNVHWLDIAVGTAFAWALGLGIALAVRQSIVRRPISRWASVLTAIAIWFCLFAIFYAISSWVGEAEAFSQRSHIGLLLVAVAAYYILVRKGKASTIVEPAASGTRVVSPPNDAPRAKLNARSVAILLLLIVLVVGLIVAAFGLRDWTIPACRQVYSEQGDQAAIAELVEEFQRTVPMVQDQENVILLMEAQSIGNSRNLVAMENWVCRAQRQYGSP